MNDQILEMDSFIKYYANIYKQNPDIPFNSDIIYNGLMNYGLSRDEQNNRSFGFELKQLENYFNANKKENGLNVFVHPSQPHFLQFNRTNNRRESKAIKIYYTTSKGHLAEAAKEIFEYIGSTDMDCYSKVADIVRADAIVVRVPTVYDAKRVLNFIDNNSYLKTVEGSTNPFLFKYGEVGIAYDDRTTYNGVTSEYISDYINHLKNNNNLDKASIEDFNKYIRNRYNNMFINCSEIDKVLNMTYFSNIRDRYNGISNGEIINNLEQVTRLLVNICSGNMKIDDYFNFYESTLAPFNEDRIRIYNDLLEKKIRNNIENDTENVTVDLEAIIKEYISYAFEKYGSSHKVHDYLEHYLDGNILGITRDKGFRDKFYKHLSPNVVYNITNGNSMKYISDTIVDVDESNEKDIKGYQVLCNSSLETAKKYGDRQLCVALKKGQEGEFGYFTNGGENNYRKQLTSSVRPSRIKNYCMRYLIMFGMELDDINLSNLEELVSNQMCNTINSNTRSM